MRDNEIIGILRQIIVAVWPQLGIGDTPEVRQNYQPTQQGVSTENQILIYKIPGDRRYGYPHRNEVWDEANQKMIRTEKQWYESSFQFNALAIQNPQDSAQLTASDILNYAAHVMQCDKALTEFKRLGLGVLRVTDVRNVPFLDDRDQFESNPSFDLIVCHEQVIVYETPTAVSIEFNIARV